MTYTNWTFPVQRLDAVTVRTCFENDPGDATGIYFQTYDGSIDGGGAYFGLQVGTLAGRLAIFSRFGTVDPGDIRVAPDGLSEIGTYEGPFVSVRHVYAFGVGCHDVRVRRADADGAQDWFEMHVSPADSAQWTYVGAIRFPRANAAVPAAHTSGGGSWTEFFTPTDNALTFPYVHVSFAATANAGIAPTHAVSNYNNNDGSPIPNANVWYDPGDKRVHHEFGGLTPQCHPAGQLF